MIPSGSIEMYAVTLAQCDPSDKLLTTGSSLDLIVNSMTDEKTLRNQIERMVKSDVIVKISRVRLVTEHHFEPI